MRKKLRVTLAGSFILILLLALAGPVQVLADEPAVTEYVVQSGDSLRKIAQTQLGDAERWTEIFELNKDVIKDPSLIFTGQNLKLPGVAQDAQAAQADKADTNEQEEAERFAQQLHDTAEKAEPAVTELLRSLESDKAHLEGLEFRLKTIESISRKILLNAHDMELSIEDASKTILDSLRYTFVIEDSEYVATTRTIIDSLLAHGCSLVSFKNSWANSSIAYQGINTVFQNEDGVIFELQIHTPSSYEAKGEKTHAYYEIIRSETASLEEKAEAKEKHDAIFAMVPVPEGVKEISY